MTDVKANITKLLAQIKQLAHHYQRQAETITLLGITKQRTVCEIYQAIQAGMRSFGENYLQEALPKIKALGKENLHWHFVGPIQANKTQTIAENFSWVHSVDRIKIAKRLSAQRSQSLPPLNVCIQVNISGETSKSGLSCQQVPVLMQEIYHLPGLRIRGLMVIPMPNQTFDEQRVTFRQLHVLFNQLNQLGFHLDTLSMGMSKDFGAAIAEGATIVRIGQAIFGPRERLIKNT